MYNKLTFLIQDFLSKTLDVFTLNDFYKYLKNKGARFSKEDALEILHSSDYVFSLINNEFITRAGVFSGRWFSFKPSKEEIEKGYIMLGHRCMPFINPDISPDSIIIISHGDVVISDECVFSMNQALDTFALYGEGYSLPYILNDKANTTVPLSSVEYGLPTEVNLTAWSLNKISPNYKLEYGDRLLCRVVNWDENVVEISVLRNDIRNMSISESAVEREEWYSYFENGFLESFDKHGPGSSIDEQLALLYLECQEELCIRHCGSAEEFLKHTKKIGFSSFGVENRIWRIGEDVPYIGNWNRRYTKDFVINHMSMTFTPAVMDAYIANNIYEELTGNKYLDTLEDLVEKVFPQEMHITPAERKIVLLNIEKRRVILKKEINLFSEYPIAELRKRILSLFTDISHLLAAIGCLGEKVESFPQQEMIIISQLFSHVAKLLEEIQNKNARSSIPIEDINLSLEGIEETFYEVSSVLYVELSRDRKKSFALVNSANEDN